MLTILVVQIRLGNGFSEIVLTHGEIKGSAFDEIILLKQNVKLNPPTASRDFTRTQ